MQQRLLPKICWKAQSLSPQWKGVFHIYALLLLEQFTQRGSRSLQTIHSQNLGFLNPAWEHSYRPSLMTAFTTEGEEEVLQQIKIIFCSITNDWSSSPRAEGSSSTMGDGNMQAMYAVFKFNTFIEPWCITASPIPVQISGFMLF